MSLTFTIDLSVMSLTERLNTDGVKLTQKVENLLILSSQLDIKSYGTTIIHFESSS